MVRPSQIIGKFFSKYSAKEDSHLLSAFLVASLVFYSFSRRRHGKIKMQGQS